MTLEQMRSSSLCQILFIASSARRQEMAALLMHKTKGRVVRGPFEGLQLLQESSWGDGDLPPKLLGCYEQELHSIVEDVVQRNHTAVLNVGCAEGYYAVGFARRMPNTKVYAYDTSKKAQEVCHKHAEANGVTARMDVRGHCDPAELNRVLSEHADAFLFVDCEGGELDLLVPDQVPGLGRCDVVVECHDFINRQITSTLRARFEATHQIQQLMESSRNPNEFPELQRLNGLDRSIIICERRPETMHWLYLRARVMCPA